MGRRGRRGKGKGKPQQQQQDDVHTGHRDPALEAGLAVTPDHLPPNSYLLGDEDEPVPVDAAGFPLNPVLAKAAMENKDPAEDFPPLAGRKPKQPATAPEQLPAAPLAPADMFSHFPAPELNEQAPEVLEQADITSFDPPPVRDAGRDVQRRLSWIADQISIGNQSTRAGLVPDVKVHAVLAMVQYGAYAPDPRQPGVREPTMDVLYMTEAIWISIPYLALPLEYRKSPARLTLERAMSIFTGFFRTFPFEVIRPRPKPRELERIPQFMKEAISRGAMANESIKEG